MNVSYASGGPSGGLYSATVLSSTTTTMSLLVLPWYNASVTLPATSSSVTFRVGVWDRASGTASGTASLSYGMSAAYTPSVLSTSPATVDAAVGGELTVVWGVRSR